MKFMKLKGRDFTFLQRHGHKFAIHNELFIIGKAWFVLLIAHEIDEISWRNNQQSNKNNNLKVKWNYQSH
jgi:hypothetical protein